MRDQVEILPTVGGGRVAVWRNVMIELPRATTLEAARALRRSIGEWMARDNRLFCVIVVIPVLELRLDSQTTAIQRELAALWKDMASRLIAIAVVLSGTGFYAATARSFLAGIQLLSRSAFPRKVFSTESDAAEWLADVMAGTGLPFGKPNELLAILTELSSTPA